MRHSKEHVPVCEKVENLVQTKKRDSRMDPLEIRNEVFAGSNKSSATAVLGLRDV